MDDVRHFFILGAAKCGTTSLRYYLNQHDEICMSEPKETCFFEVDDRYEKGRSYYHEEFFDRQENESVLGDARHRNLYFEWIPERIKELFPGAKFIVLVRNPVERAFSHYWQWVQYEKESLSFGDSLVKNYRRIKSDGIEGYHDEYQQVFRENKIPRRSYLDTGYYLTQIKRYWNTFGKEAVRVYRFRDLVQSTATTVNDILSFLDLNPVKNITTEQKNTGIVPRSRSLHRIIFQLGSYSISNYVPEVIKQSIESMIYGEKNDVTMDDLTELWLYQHFETRIKKLNNNLNLDLSHWSYEGIDGLTNL